MTTYYIRPGSSDHGGSSSYGDNSGLSYDNAFPGLNYSAAQSVLESVAEDEIFICGEHLREVSNTYTAPALIRFGQGLNERQRKVIRFDYPGDPGVVWSGALGMYSDYITIGTNLYQKQLNLTFGEQMIPPYIHVWNSGSPTRLLRAVDYASCAATENTYFFDANKLLTVHLTNGVSPTNNIVLAKQGYLPKLNGNTKELEPKYLYFHWGYFRDTTRFVQITGSGGVYYQPKHVEFNNCFWECWEFASFYCCYPTEDLSFRECTWSGGQGPAIYPYGNSYNEVGVAVSQKETTKNLKVQGCLFEKICYDVNYQSDSRPLEIQWAQDILVCGCEFGYTPGASVFWVSDQSTAQMPNQLWQYNICHHLHQGLNNSLANDLQNITGLCSSTNLNKYGTYNNFVIQYNLFHSFSPFSGWTLEGDNYRVTLCGRYTPEEGFTFNHNVIIDHPGGPFLLASAATMKYAKVMYNTVKNPTLFRAGHCDVTQPEGFGFDYNTYIDSLADETSFRRNLSAVVSKTEWLSLSYDTHSTFI